MDFFLYVLLLDGGSFQGKNLQGDQGSRDRKLKEDDIIGECYCGTSLILT